MQRGQPPGSGPGFARRGWSRPARPGAGGWACPGGAQRGPVSPGLGDRAAPAGRAAPGPGCAMPGAVPPPALARGGGPEAHWRVPRPGGRPCTAGDGGWRGTSDRRFAPGPGRGSWRRSYCPLPPPPGRGLGRHRQALRAGVGPAKPGRFRGRGEPSAAVAPRAETVALAREGVPVGEARPGGGGRVGPPGGAQRKPRVTGQQRGHRRQASRAPDQGVSGGWERNRRGGRGIVGLGVAFRVGARPGKAGGRGIAAVAAGSWAWGWRCASGPGLARPGSFGWAGGRGRPPLGRGRPPLGGERPRWAGGRLPLGGERGEAPAAVAVGGS